MKTKGYENQYIAKLHAIVELGTRINEQRMEQRSAIDDLNVMVKVHPDLELLSR